MVAPRTNVVWILLLLLVYVHARFVYCQEASSAGLELTRFDDDSDDDDDDQLIFVHTMCRHGDRNIYRSYPNDEWASEEFWPGGYSALTNLGKQQQYELGQYLRERYASLLGRNGEYSPDIVYVRATDTDRTLMSAQSALAGLFPPSDDQIWNEDLDWQPIPVHTMPASQDYVVATQKKCNRFDFEMLKFMNSSTYRGLFKEHSSLIDYLRMNSQLELKTITQIVILFDTLLVEKLKGKCLPDWAERVLTPGGDFEYLARFFYGMHTSNDVMKKLKAGFLLKEIFDRCRNKTQSTLTPDRSLWMYFVHDITMTNILNSLGLFKMQFQMYASCLFFEMWKGLDGKPYVKIFNRNSAETKVSPLVWPRCGSKCPLERLYEMYSEILPTRSFDEECKLPPRVTLNRKNPESYTLE